MNLPSGEITFLFTDIEGSTKLSQLFPDTLQESLKRHNELLQKAIDSNNGYTFEITGDAFSCVFEKADDAVKAALDAQLSLAGEKWENAEIKIRIGIHTGKAEWNGERYMGYMTLARTERVMSCGYGEQIIISGSAYDLCKLNFIESKRSVLFRDLGERRLKDVIQPIRLYQVISPGLREEFPSLKTLDARPNNFPVQLTSFIGREKELEEIKSGLMNSRLLTLIGTGGSGKTRLAMQAGADLIDEYSNGVIIVELAAVSDRSLVAQTMLNSIGSKEIPGKNIEESLTEYLKDKELLIILDNCEHLISECAKLSELILSKCPEIKILSTSRESLNCSGEKILRTPSLTLPDINKKNNPEQLMQFEAIRLFTERALSVNPDFRVNNENTFYLVQICCRLDGIPLAIELAAVRRKLLTLNKIYERLNNRFKLLTGGNRTSLQRQQTLKAMIDWSYDLLSENEKTLWGRLSVFSGGWTLEAAEEICSDDKIQKHDILDLLSSLTEKSVIIYDSEKDRYRILETIKQYGEEKLMEINERERFFLNHLKYYKDFAIDSGPKVELSEAEKWLEILENEHSNFQTAIQYSAKSGNSETGGHIAFALGRFWLIRGHYATGKLLIENILDNADGISLKLKSWLICSQGNLTILQGEFEEARSFLNKSLSLSRENDDKVVMAFSQIGLGSISFFQGDNQKAYEYYSESLINNRSADDRRGIAMSLNNLGMVSVIRNEIEKAKAYFEESLSIYREIGYKTQTANPLHNLGLIADNQGDYETAEKYYGESLLINKEKGDRRGMANTILNLGLVAYNRNNLENAKNLFEQCGELYEQLGDKLGKAFYKYGLGIVYDSYGNFEEGMKYLEESLAIRTEIGDITGMVNSLNRLGLLSLKSDKRDQSKEFLKQSILENEKAGDEWSSAVSVIIYAGIYCLDKKYDLAAKLTGACESNLKSTDRVLETGVEIFKQNILAEINENMNREEFLKQYEEGKKLSLNEALSVIKSEK